MQKLLAAHRRRVSEGEAGFTLIELLIVLVILPLVMGAIVMVLITTLKNDQSVSGTVADSSAASLSSSFYTRDIESAGAVFAPLPNTPVSVTPAPCSAAGLSGSPTLVLALQLQGTSPPSEVSYYTWAPGVGASELVREFCTGGSSTPQSHEILSDNLSIPNPPVAVVPCAAPTPTSIPTGVTCTPGSTWTPTYMVSTITLNVTQGCSGVGSCAPYQFAVSGDPQSGVPVPPVNEPCGVLTLLSPTTSNGDINLGLDVLGTEQLTVQGPIVLNAGYNTAGSNNAAIQTNVAFGTQNVSATGVTSCPNSPTGVPNADAIGIYNCNNTSSSGSTTNYTACPTGSGQHTTVSGVSLTPTTPVQLSLGPNQNNIPDPLAAWASQNPVTNITSPAVTCPASTTMNCPPGVYASGLTIPNNATVTFQAGNYQFNGSVNCSGTQTSLCIENNDTVNFGSGHYTYTNGLDMAGSGSALCGGLAATTSCPHPPSGGVFFYVAGGGAELGNNFFSSNVVQLSAITSSADPYQYVLLWQAVGDNSQVVVASPNNSNATNTLAGEIYAPAAPLFINGWGGNVATQDIVSYTLSFGGTGFFNSLGLTVSPIP